MLGSTVLIPFLVIPPMGGTPEDLAAGEVPSSMLAACKCNRPCICFLQMTEESCPAFAVIGTIFFISGIITLVQTIAGDRLPIIQVNMYLMFHENYLYCKRIHIVRCYALTNLWMVQGGSFAYLTPTFAIIAQIKNRQDWQDAPDGTNHERFLVILSAARICSKMFNIKCLQSNLSVNYWLLLLQDRLLATQVTMREVQGGIIASAFFIMFFSMSGLLRAVLHFISPITGKAPYYIAFAILPFLSLPCTVWSLHVGCTS